MNSGNHLGLTTLVLALLLSAPKKSPAGESRIRVLHERKDPSHAVLRVRANERSPYPIPKFITGKFAEHLGWNIYNGMDAQILMYSSITRPSDWRRLWRW